VPSVSAVTPAILGASNQSIGATFDAVMIMRESTP
jgi:hypothetical protein